MISSGGGRGQLPLNTVRPKILSARLIPAPHSDLTSAVEGKKAIGNSYGLVSCDFQPALFVALDEATKSSPVTIVRARPVVAGLPRLSDPLTGEAFGLLSGTDDEIVREGLKAVIRTLEN